MDKYRIPVRKDCNMPFRYIFSWTFMSDEFSEHFIKIGRMLSRRK